jgi:hypothetical protein
MRRGYSAYNANGAEDATVVQEVATIPVVQDQKLVSVGQGLYNPPFKAQIQVNFLKYYFSYNAGVFTPVAAGAVPAALQLQLPTFLFSNSDFASGFAKLQGQFPVSGWAYGGAPFIYNNVPWPGTPASGIFDANVRNLLRAGDLVIPFTGANGGTNYVALAVIRTSDVPYGTLLDALNSNTFNINLIRYTVTAGQETQFANAILCADETMFGKFSSDPVNPESYKNPEQDQDNIVDIDIDFNVNKQRGLASYVNYDVVSMRWNLFISSANKVI